MVLVEWHGGDGPFVGPFLESFPDRAAAEAAIVANFHMFARAWQAAALKVAIKLEGAGNDQS